MLPATLAVVWRQSVAFAPHRLAERADDLRQTSLPADQVAAARRTSADVANGSWSDHLRGFDDSAAIVYVGE